MNMLHLIEMSILSGLCFAGLIALLSVPLHKKFKGQLAKLPCRIRARILVVWLISPLMMGILFPLSGLLPTLIDQHALSANHCLSHDNGIAHLCWFNPNLYNSNPLWSLGIILLAIGIAFCASKAFVKLIKSRNFLAALRAISSPDCTRGVFHIATNKTFVFSAGLLHPQIFVSTNLIDQLTTKQLDVVLAHERAHCQRRDVLRRVLLRLVAVLHSPGIGKALFHDVELAHEQICDEAAAKAVDDRLCVAETIVKMERCMRVQIPSQTADVIAFNGSHIEARIQVLLEAPEPVSRRMLFFSSAFWVASFSGMLALSMPLHHLSLLF
ncbi:MAG: M56 family metallopeptidase [Pseudomonadota bacterium]